MEKLHILGDTTLVYIKNNFYQINIACVFLVVLTIAIIRGLPKIWPRIPGILPAVIVASLIAYFFHFEKAAFGDVG